MIKPVKWYFYFFFIDYSEEGLCLPLQQAVCNLTDIFCSGENCVGDSCVQFTSSSCPATENEGEKFK